MNYTAIVRKRKVVKTAVRVMEFYKENKNTNFVFLTAAIWF